MQNIERVLVPIDLSERSLAALKVAQQMAKYSGAEVRVLTVDQQVVNSVSAIGIGVMQSSIGPYSVPKTHDQIADLLCEFTESSGLNCDGLKYQVVDGSPATAIVEYAKDNQIDLIVMTTHGHTGLTRMLMGSVAEKVVRTATCPVLTLSDRCEKE